MTYFSELNVALSSLPRMGAIMMARGYGPHAGRTASLEDVKHNDRIYTRVTVDGVSLHFPQRQFRDHELTAMAFDRIPRDRN